jgi:hypothetical protein
LLSFSVAPAATAAEENVACDTACNRQRKSEILGVAVAALTHKREPEELPRRITMALQPIGDRRAVELLEKKQNIGGIKRIPGKCRRFSGSGSGGGLELLGSNAPPYRPPWGTGKQRSVPAQEKC